MRGPFGFFLLVFALSIPFWVLGEATGRQLLPGLPIGALSAFCPAAAAFILGPRAQLLRRSFDPRGLASRYAPGVLLKPAIFALMFVIARAAGGGIPDPSASLTEALLLFLAFLAAGVGEEIGWTGFALDPMQRRLGALGAALTIGVVWAAWHLVALAQAHRSAEWIAWWCLGTVATRVLMVWLYNNTRSSVLAVSLFHAFDNLGWQLYPIRGSYWDPRPAALLTAAAAALVVIVWGPRTLAGRDQGLTTSAGPRRSRRW